MRTAHFASGKNNPSSATISSREGDCTRFTTKWATFQSSIHVFNASLERQFAVIVRELREAAGRVVGRLALGFAAVTVALRIAKVNAVGIEANAAFLGLSLVLLGVFNRIFFPMHYKNAYDLGKPFLLSSIALALGVLVLETLQHILPYLNDVCDSYAAADQLRQIPVLLGGLLVFSLLTARSFTLSVHRFEAADL